MSITISSQERLSLISNLATMLSSGIPILEAIDSLLDGAKGNQKKLLENLHHNLNQGKSISDSMSHLPKIFDPITVNLVKAAEESGTLETTLKDIAINLKKELEFSDKVKGALAYPAVVLLTFLGVVIVILTFVIPRIATVFGRLKVTLPLPTKILIAISSFFLDYTIFIVGGLVILGFILFFVYRFNKKFLLNIFFSLPLLSKLAKQIDLARFTRSFSLLLYSGIPIVNALELSQNVVSKMEINMVIRKCREKVNSGKKLSEGFFENKKVIPIFMVKITETGEKSGTLEKSMQELSEYFEGQVETALKTLTTLLEPILIVVIGLLIGGVMLAIIAPIYNLIGQIKPR